MKKGGLSGWDAVLAVAIGAMLWLTSGPLADVDVYWHVLLGRDILSAYRLTGDPSWTFGHTIGDWRTSQWGSDVLFWILYKNLGWAGLTLLRVGTATSVVVLLWTTIRNGTGRALGRVIVLGLVVLAVGTDTVERPAAIGLVFTAILSVVVWRIVEAGIWPRWWCIALGSALWANMHGSWVLVPVAFTAAAVCHYLGGRSVPLMSALLTPIVAVLAASFTPLGLSIYSVMWNITHAAQPFIQEWQTTTVSGTGILLAVILIIVIGTCAYTHKVMPVTHLVWVFGWAAFGAYAFRNVTPALVLMAPPCATYLAHAFPQRWERPRTLAISVTAGIILGAATIASLAQVALSPRLPSWTPSVAYAALSDGQVHRVVTAYNLSGQTLALTPNTVRIAIDGRTDRYGSDYLLRYLDMFRGAQGWQETFSSLDPTDVLTPTSAPLTRLLIAQGWQVTAKDLFSVLLHSPRVSTLTPSAVPRFPE